MREKMSNKPILYSHPLSPPVRAVLMTAAELGIEIEEKPVDLLNGEHKKPEFVKMNPQHTVPFLDDNGVLIADSHAICAYLSEKYGKTDRLYPKDLAKRAIIDARLHFDSGHLFARMRFLIEPILFQQSTEMPAERIQYIQTAWDILERFLDGTSYVCGDEMTIADLCIVATAASTSGIVPYDPLKHANIMKWMERMSKLPYYEEYNGSRSTALHELYRNTLKKNIESK